MSAESDDLELPDVLRELAQSHGVSASYHVLWGLIVQGSVPAHRFGRRWRVRPGDLPAIAEALRATRRPKIVA